MTVTELRKKLQGLDGKIRVVVDGYEGGLDDLGSASVVKIQLHVHPEGYYGDHDIWDKHLGSQRKKKADETALHLSRC